MKLVAVDNIADAIEITDKNKVDDIVFIKTSDLKEWTNNRNSFTNKSFGDNLSGLIVNFIYKDGDPDLKPEKLTEELRKFILLKNL